MGRDMGLAATISRGEACCVDIGYLVKTVMYTMDNGQRASKQVLD